MSNHSVQTHLATAEAVQSLASTDNPQTCAKKAKAPPPTIRTVSVLPDSHWRKPYLDLCRGNHNAAEVLGKITFRYQPDKDHARLKTIRHGHYWWYHTIKELAEECDLTLEQAKYALVKLREWGLVETRANGAKVRGLRVSLFRLPVAQGAGSLNGWPTFADTPAKVENSTTAKVENSTLKASKVVEGEPKEENLNTQSVTSASAVTHGHDPVKPETGSGKIKTSKKPEASKPFLGHYLTRKLEWLKEATNDDNPAGCLLPELTDTDRDVCQRLEYRLTSAGLDALAFLDWLTPFRFQQFAFDQWDQADYATLWIGKTKHQQLLIAEYRQHLADQQTDADKIAAAQADAVALEAKLAAERDENIKAYVREHPTPDYSESKMGPQWRARVAELRAEYWPEQAANQPTTPLADSTECVAVPEVVEPVTEPVVVKETPAPCADQCDGGYTWQDVLDGWAAEAARTAQRG
ncbi:hypothetical protein R75471_05527 [Paraburkholderia domus]|nr:hypothetical protein R75471_05527 [Paraburkholderia domus]